MAEPTSLRTFTLLCPFGGLGAGARGFLDASVDLCGERGEFHLLGSIDFDDVACADAEQLTGRPTSPIYMPRALCREELLVTDVRVQRLHDISEEDARAEGLTMDSLSGMPITMERDGVRTEGTMAWTSAAYAYAFRWEAINAKRGFPWSNNDWVVATTFARKAA